MMKRGPRKRPKAEVRTELFFARLTAREKARFSRIAKQRGITTSSLFREWICGGC